MTSQRRLLVGALGLALIVGACGGAAAKTPTPTDQGGGGGTTPTAQPTDQGGGGTTPTEAPLSFEPGNATGLEALIPDKIGTQTITKTSFDYGSIPWSSLSGAFGNGDLEQVLKDNGKTLSDVAFAMGVSTTSGASGMPTMIYAFQVKGLDASKFVNGVDSSYGTAPDLTLGGKQVKGSVSGGFAQVTYLHADVAFVIICSEADANDLLSALP